jgi:tetratricopeptide (TPR) repeat protein
MIFRALLFMAMAVAAFGQLPDPNKGPKIFLKDGQVIASMKLRRDRDTIMATVSIPSKTGGAPTQGEFGFELSKIAKLDFPKPTVLDTLPPLIGDGKAEDALKELDPYLKYYEGFLDAPGSWWPDLVPIKIQGLLALRRDKEAADEAEKFARLASDPEYKKLVRIFNAVAMTRKGDHESALRMYADSTTATKRQDMLGLISVNKGDSLVAVGDVLKKKGEVEQALVRYEQALLSYLRIPALYPSQRMYMPQVTLGSARAYLGFEDFPRARLAVKELKEKYPTTPEAKEVEALSAKIDEREKQLADPKEKLLEKPAA